MKKIILTFSVILSTVTFAQQKDCDSKTYCEAPAFNGFYYACSAGYQSAFSSNLTNQDQPADIKDAIEKTYSLYISLINNATVYNSCDDTPCPEAENAYTKGFYKALSCK